MQNTCGVVSADPWKKDTLTLGPLTIRGRKTWAWRVEPIWANEVIYYNTRFQPLNRTLKEIIIHHTANLDSLRKIEETQQRDPEKKFAAIGYHFIIARDGTIFLGRPLKVIGSHAGKGKIGGPENDPDWGSVGIALIGDFEGWVRCPLARVPDKPKKEQMESLKQLVITLKRQFDINTLSMHKELNAARVGEPTVCPGTELDIPIRELRTSLNMSPGRWAAESKRQDAERPERKR